MLKIHVPIVAVQKAKAVPTIVTIILFWEYLSHWTI